jgi:phage repressor protein C with HTH and peptisase S24 domain
MPVVTTHIASYFLLELAIPGQDPAPAGVLLHDSAHDRLYVRLRRDWEEIAPGEADMLSLIDSDLAAKAAELGAASLLTYLEDALSNVLRIGERHAVTVADFERSLDRLYLQHVPSTVQEFVTHLPRYSLAVAAGKFLENEEVSGEGWDEAPPGLKLTRDMFTARIVGRSMEPLIPDASLCVFRAGVTGSRQGKLVLVEALGRGSNDRYTVKRYRSEKTRGQADEEWSHARIRLEPLNPEFEAWDLDPREEANLRILAEFVQVLD